MGILDLKYTLKQIGNGFNYGLSIAKFRQFNSSLLDLGDISAIGEERNALAAVFDLEDFTSFCSQIDPHLVIPEYLSTFLDWLFWSISHNVIQKEEKRSIVLWCQLPFYAKFLGDGVLFLWDTKTLEPEMMGNIVQSLRSICEEYRKKLLPEITKSVSTRAPTRLRCGIARGKIVPIGEEKDFVGPCINLASRLQKLEEFSFAFSNRGFASERCFTPRAQKDFVLIKAPIRGIGEGELIYVLKSEFRLLDNDEKKKFKP